MGALIFGIAPPIAGSRFAVSAQAAVTCDRKCLSGLMDSYLSALQAANPGHLPVASGVRYTLNALAMPLGAGLRGPVGAPLYRIDATDPVNGQVASNVVLTENGIKVILFARLKQDGGQISEIETIIIRPGEGQRSDPEAMIGTSAVYAQPASGESRTELVAAADTYLSALALAGTPEYRSPPFAPGMIRIENGITVQPRPDGHPPPSMDQMLRTGFGTDKLHVSDRRYPVIDQERGIVVAIGVMHVKIGPKPPVPPGSPPQPKAHAFERPNLTQVLVEFFKVEQGKIVQIRATMFDLNDPHVTTVGW